MPTQTPAEELASKITSLQTRLGWLQDSVRLTSVRDDIEDVQTTVDSLDQRIAELRSRGYVFGKELEAQAADYVEQWTKLSPTLNQQINIQSNGLQVSLRPLETQMNQLAAQSRNPIAGLPIAKSLETNMGTIQDKVSSVERTIHGMYDKFNNQLYALTKQLNEIEWMLTELSEATFQLMPTEAGIMAVKAIWAKNGKEQKGDPEGVLFLTDQRLLFEQKEEIATKKVLFVTTEKQKVQKLQLEAPVALVENVQTSKQGMLKNEDHIDVKFAVGAPVQVAHFHIWQPCEEWQALLNRTKAKEFDQDRAVALDQEAVEKVKAAPSQCPSCGGNISQVILRGMDSIKCEYCGFVIRL
jgi:hypothetical protein